jgi:hypothetical protein
MKTAIALLIALLATAFASCNPAGATSPDGSPCVIAGSTGVLGGAQGVMLKGHCLPDLSEAAPTGPPTKTIACGSAVALASKGWNAECGPPQSCTSIDPLSHKTIVKTAFATLTLVNSAWRNPVVWCPGVAAPAVTMADIQEQAFRLLPHVAIGSAWTTTALVQAETVLWAGTGTDRSLGAVQIVGRTVHLRIAFDHAAWNFGDGSTDTVTTPGKPYDKTGDPCHTAQCADYYGHTYERTGPMTISLSVTWHAQFSFDNATWTDIPQPITGPTAQHTITLMQARGILVPPPNP